MRNSKRGPNMVLTNSSPSVIIMAQYRGGAKRLGARLQNEFSAGSTPVTPVDKTPEHVVQVFLVCSNQTSQSENAI